MGVNALFASAISGIRQRLDGTRFTVFDSGSGMRNEEFHVDSRGAVEIRFLGYRTGRRIYLPENLHQMQFAAHVGKWGGRLNSGVRAILESTAVLDVSGGDSFTDMYPGNRIKMVAGCKEVALQAGRPLILLPQTYGPFDESLDRAKNIVRRSWACFARDERSFESLKGLLGDQFDPDRHKCGVDMAFGLEPRSASDSIDDELKFWIEDKTVPLIGLNVSGLIGNRAETGRESYGFKADYRATIEKFVRRVLDGSEARVVIVPHVMSPIENPESDLQASRWLKNRFSGAEAERILISPTSLDQGQVKWVISKMDWFCGTRMHATIAGLSSCIPTSTISYSDKALGVFETCKQGGEVFDPRSLDTDVVVEALLDSFSRRDSIAKSLQANIPTVKNLASQQMDQIVASIEACKGKARP